jgi:hypothetical protein
MSEYYLQLEIVSFFNLYFLKLPVCFADAGLDEREETLPKQPWTSSEKKIVHKNFAKHIQNNKLPGKKNVSVLFS